MDGMIASRVYMIKCPTKQSFSGTGDENTRGFFWQECYYKELEYGGEIA